MKRTSRQLLDTIVAAAPRNDFIAVNFLQRDGRIVGISACLFENSRPSKYFNEIIDLNAREDLSGSELKLNRSREFNELMVSFNDWYRQLRRDFQDSIRVVHWDNGAALQRMLKNAQYSCAKPTNYAPLEHLEDWFPLHEMLHMLWDKPWIEFYSYSLAELLQQNGIHGGDVTRLGENLGKLYLLYSEDIRANLPDLWKKIQAKEHHNIRFIKEVDACSNEEMSLLYDAIWPDLKVRYLRYLDTVLRSRNSYHFIARMLERGISRKMLEALFHRDYIELVEILRDGEVLLKILDEETNLAAIISMQRDKIITVYANDDEYFAQRVLRHKIDNKKPLLSFLGKYDFGRVGETKNNIDASLEIAPVVDPVREFKLTHQEAVDVGEFGDPRQLLKSFMSCEVGKTTEDLLNNFFSCEEGVDLLCLQPSKLNYIQKLIDDELQTGSKRSFILKDKDSVGGVTYRRRRVLMAPDILRLQTQQGEFQLSRYDDGYHLVQLNKIMTSVPLSKELLARLLPAGDFAAMARWNDSAEQQLLESYISNS